MRRRSPHRAAAPAAAAQSALEAAYRATVYRVTPTDGVSFDLRVGRRSAPLDALLGATGQTTWCWLTAVNPGSRRLGARANAARLAALDRDLAALPLAVVAGVALDPAGRWPPEPSRLVLGLDAEGGRGLALRFGQRAFLTGELGGPAHLEWTHDPRPTPKRPKSRATAGE